MYRTTNTVVPHWILAGIGKSLSSYLASFQTFNLNILQCPMATRSAKAKPLRGSTLKSLAISLGSKRILMTDCALVACDFYLKAWTVDIKNKSF
jgi:hypothetical protein